MVVLHQLGINKKSPQKTLNKQKSLAAVALFTKAFVFALSFKL